MKKITLDDLPKKDRKLPGKKKPDLKKMEGDYWRVIALNKKIEKAVTTYLNDHALSAEPQQLNYQNNSITGFICTAEMALMIHNSPEEYDVRYYLILHRRKDRREHWRMWKG